MKQSCFCQLVVPQDTSRTLFVTHGHINKNFNAVLFIAVIILHENFKRSRYKHVAQTYMFIK